MVRAATNDDPEPNGHGPPLGTSSNGANVRSARHTRDVRSPTPRPQQLLNLGAGGGRAANSSSSGISASASATNSPGVDEAAVAQACGAQAAQHYIVERRIGPRRARRAT